MIFLGPYYTTGPAAQNFWNAAIMQSTGRAARHGQRKQVYSYFLLNRHSAEVDVFEKRTDMIIPEWALRTGECTIDDMLPRKGRSTECGSLVDRLIRREK